MSDSIPVLRPLPQRAFRITPVSTQPSTPPSGSAENNDSAQLNARSNVRESFTPSRTRSTLNLTSSTLFGIFSPADNEGVRDDFNTPFGTGAMTPASPRTPSLHATDATTSPVIAALNGQPLEKKSPYHATETLNVLASIIIRTTLLFMFGTAYGIIVTHLHDDQRVAPVKVGGIDQYSWAYLIFWGVAGVALGNLLPWVDIVWRDALGPSLENGQGNHEGANSTSIEINDGKAEVPAAGAGSGLGADWNPVVRSIGAFIGIAFAIVRIPTLADYHKLLIEHLEKTSLAVDTAGVVDSSSRQSCSVVHNRSLQAGFRSLSSCWHYRNCFFDSC